MFYSSVYSKDSQDVSWDAAHLYEHYFIAEFEDFLEERGIARGVYGYLDGETFERAIFLSAGIYTETVNRLLQDFVLQPLSFDKQKLDKVLRSMEAEERCRITVDDNKLLLAQLHILNGRAWTKVQSIKEGQIIPHTALSVKNPLQLHKSAKSFRELVVALYIEAQHIAESELYLRFSVMLGDVIARELTRKFDSLYELDRSPLHVGDSQIGFMIKLRVQKGVTLKDIEKAAQQALERFDLDTNMPYVRAHFEGFAQNANWESLLVDYYRGTGIITSRQRIASLATPERLRSILAGTKFRVSAWRPEYEEYF